MGQVIDRRGLLFGATAYFIWGLFPILMKALEPSNAFEIVAWRALSSLVVCLLIALVIGAWRRVWAVASDRRVLGRLAMASAFISANWGVMVYAVVTDRVSETSLGYYINPLVTVALSVVFLGERLRRLQMVAIAVAGIAVALLAIEAGGLPWISIVLALSFAFYSFIKKGIGDKVDALSGLTVETALIGPFAVLTLWLVERQGATTFLARDGDGLGWWHDVMLIGTGTWTAGALLIFAAGARRLPLNVTGLLQYIAPTMTFVLAVTYFDEAMPTNRWFGFGLVWIALVLITFDAWRTRARVAKRAGERRAEEQDDEPVTEPI